MLTEDERATCVANLLESHRTKVQGKRPSEMFPHIKIEDSYAISSAVADAKVKAGARVIGHKVGLTSRAMQASSKIDEPDYGYMFDDLLLADGAKVPFDSFCVPRVEPELTFILKDRLVGPNIGLVDVLRATEWIVPSIEIIDARVTEPRKIFDTVADNGAAAGLVLGGRPMRPDDVDLRWAGAIFYRNSDIEETGLAAGVLGHPAMAIAWLANKLAQFGDGLEPGQMILSGSFTRPVWAAKGDTLHADFGPLGSVAVQFV
ncbi:2-oxo-hept-3-ene-1,7-dioate hydratase [Paenochrobactrum gallinarii]|uniref:2-oxo-hept-3-ene-1,7-dioate hydratase n=1 Tax=Paenochrobactrum gallinarii TaxID=643673 RepID=A0A841MAN4_9HYPH|nr:2-oxo-hepta-3-ene-1,7-dioate hydratase [Paenochrobactrum gallinarii]MBB6262584.1 2-oxo-hept-3-ene-1,7-dioate hydratase [Paenochrobactrum gallinarii]